MSVNKRKTRRFLRKYKKVLIITAIVSIVLCAIPTGTLIYLKKTTEKFDNVGVDINEENLGIENTEVKEGYLTFALFGVDSGDEGIPRSDSIIIANVNKDTGEIQLVSVYRDTFMFVEDWPEHSKDDTQYTKINHAYTIGPEASIKALNQNLALHITDYASVDFVTIAKLVDAVGGIEVTLPDKKNFIFYLNGFGEEGAIDAGEKFTRLSENMQGKTVTLNGYQALGYCRVRKATVSSRPLSGESDYTRASRQQEVIGKLIGKIKTKGVSVIGDLVKICQDQKNMETSMTWSEITSLATDAIKNNYALSEDAKLHFPENPHEVKMWSSGLSTQYSEISLLEDVENLHAKLYPDQTLSEEELRKVKEINEQLEKYEEKYYPAGVRFRTASPAPSATASSTNGTSATNSALATKSASTTKSSTTSKTK